MAYKAMIRHAKISKMTNCDKMEALLDGWLKEGTDQGWTLHKYHITDWHQVAQHVVHLVWETND